MFERFTGRARHVVVLAQEEARQLHHNYIGTEHVLLGLLGETDGVAFRALDGFGMSLEGTRRETVAIVGTGKAQPSGHIPFTPRAKKTLELALREALQLHHNYIGTEHVLLGVIREGDGVGAQLLKQHGELSAIREAVLDLLPSVSQESSLARRWLRRRAITSPGAPGTLGRGRPERDTGRRRHPQRGSAAGGLAAGGLASPAPRDAGRSGYRSIAGTGGPGRGPGEGQASAARRRRHRHYR